VAINGLATNTDRTVTVSDRSLGSNVRLLNYSGRKRDAPVDRQLRIEEFTFCSSRTSSVCIRDHGVALVVRRAFERRTVERTGTDAGGQCRRTEPRTLDGELSGSVEEIPDGVTDGT
jgi:hypothetical protein